MMVRFLASGLVATMLMAGLQTWRLDRERLAHATTVAEHAALMAAAEEATRAAEAHARTEERRRIEALQGVVHETERRLARARADAAAAADAGQRLRAQIAAATAGCRGAPGDSTATGTGPATESTERMLAYVQRRLDDFADRASGFADQAHAAGRACERAHDALIVR